MAVPGSIFVTGIGTGIGKTLVSAVLTEAFGADYWKPVQAGSLDHTDSDIVRELISSKESTIHPETYRLKLAASPHIAARDEGIKISLEQIVRERPKYQNKKLIIEGAGGLMVPMNKNEFVFDLIRELDVPVVLVSRNTLGSINHSLLTALACEKKGIAVVGWIFNDNYLSYESEIVAWTGIQKLFSIPSTETPDKFFVRDQADLLRKQSSDWK